MTKAAALHSFFSSFGIPAYAETSVPSDAEYPYLTYTPVFDSWGTVLSLTVNLWYLTESEALPNAKAQEIADRLPVYVPCDGGSILVSAGSPFCQSVLAEKENVKQRYININAEYLTLK